MSFVYWTRPASTAHASRIAIVSVSSSAVQITLTFCRGEGFYQPVDGLTLLSVVSGFKDSVIITAPLISNMCVCFNLFYFFVSFFSSSFYFSPLRDAVPQTDFRFRPNLFALRMKTNAKTYSAIRKAKCFVVEWNFDALDNSTA